MKSKNPAYAAAVFAARMYMKEGKGRKIDQCLAAAAHKHGIAPSAIANYLIGCGVRAITDQPVLDDEQQEALDAVKSALEFTLFNADFDGTGIVSPGCPAPYSHMKCCGNWMTHG